MNDNIYWGWIILCVALGTLTTVAYGWIMFGIGLTIWGIVGFLESRGYIRQPTLSEDNDDEL